MNNFFVVFLFALFFFRAKLISVRCDCQRGGQNNIHRSMKIIVTPTIDVVNNGDYQKIDVKAKMSIT